MRQNHEHECAFKTTPKQIWCGAASRISVDGTASDNARSRQVPRNHNADIGQLADKGARPFLESHAALVSLQAERCDTRLVIAPLIETEGR